MRLFTDVASRIEDQFLRRAYALAELGRGTTSPNPMVGCVLVRDGVVVGEGFHERAGGPHAEIVALRAAGKSAQGATAYVTLEPCNHTGLTPPCTDALISAGVSVVVIGMPDPNDEAAGGASALRAAGIEVRFAEDPAPFSELNEAWLHYLVTLRPYVQVKVALSLDAHPTSALGVRSQVSGPESGEITMRLRAAADAVLVGSSTARSDDPALTVRDSDGKPMQRQPLRVVLGRAGVPDVSLFHDGLGDSLALVPTPADVPDDVTPVRYDSSGDSSADLHAAFAALAVLGVRRVLVEPGPGLFTALWAADLIDEITIIHAGGVFGDTAPGVFLGRPRENHGAQASQRLDRRIKAVEAGIIDGDAVTVWRPREAQGALTRPQGDRE